MRLIDADALERAVMFLGEDSICNDCAYEFVSLIDEQPTIEAEPVIRCENCKHLVAHGGGEAYHCWIHGASVEEDDWCSWAEARGEE